MSLTHTRGPLFFFFNDTATTEIYTLSLHDALPICCTNGYSAPFGSGTLTGWAKADGSVGFDFGTSDFGSAFGEDRKSTRLNSSHGYISYAVFCLKKKIAVYSGDQLQRLRSSTGPYH